MNSETNKTEEGLESPSPHEDFSKRRTEEARNDPRTNEELVNLALAARAEEDKDKSWDAMITLHYRGNHEVFEAAKRLCKSSNSNERCLGADILGQLGIPDRVFPTESVDFLLPILETEKDSDVLNSIAVALGHIHDPRAIEPLSKLKDHTHENVRYGVVFGLLYYEDDLAIKTLIELSADVDEDVRDWATFGLGGLWEDTDENENITYMDTLEIREALAARLTDDFEEARLEGIFGLALRKDKRALEPLKELIEDSDRVSYAYLEAATALADPSLLPGLLDLRREGEINESLEEAIEACGGKRN